MRSSATDTKSQYLEIATFEWLIQNRLAEGQPEGQTSRIWNEILHHIFTLEKGYTTGFETDLSNGGPDLFPSLVVFDVNHNEDMFVVIGYKALGPEEQTSTWAEGAEQLQRYLRQIETNNRKFGAIAIGKCVRFYEWVKQPDEGYLVDFQGDGATYLLDRQCQTVTEKLVYFREHHHP
ncbi:hypothetical protein F4778DRAFT_664914 [Xylariomycetidae sp. FL2044]|nr:hypothetical protein F4778DRAFT_664914 [Xylariomycetidae sp. FL2044]